MTQRQREREGTVPGGTPGTSNLSATCVSLGTLPFHPPPCPLPFWVFLSCCETLKLAVSPFSSSSLRGPGTPTHLSLFPSLPFCISRHSTTPWAQGQELGCPLWLCAYLWVTAEPLWSKAHCFAGWSKHKGEEESRPLKGRVTE